MTHRATQSKPCEPKLRGWPGVGKSAKISSGLHRDQLLYSGLFQDITSLNCSNSRSQLIWPNSSDTNSSDSVGRFGWTGCLWPRRSAAIAQRLVLERLTATRVPETYECSSPQVLHSRDLDPGVVSAPWMVFLYQPVFRCFKGPG